MEALTRMEWGLAHWHGDSWEALMKPGTLSPYILISLLCHCRRPPPRTPLPPQWKHLSNPIWREETASPEETALVSLEVAANQDHADSSADSPPLFASQPVPRRDLNPDRLPKGRYGAAHIRSATFQKNLNFLIHADRNPGDLCGHGWGALFLLQPGSQVPESNDGHESGPLTTTPSDPPGQNM